MLIEDLIKKVEANTGKEFDLKNRKHLFLLNSQIERLNQNELRILSLIRQSLASTNSEESLFNSKIQYVKNRFREH